jgi:hypothetical protein
LFASGAVVSHSFGTFDLHTTCSFPTIVIQGILDLVASGRNKSYQPRVPPLQKGGPKSDSASVRRCVLGRPRNLSSVGANSSVPYLTLLYLRQAIPSVPRRTHPFTRRRAALYSQSFVSSL